MILISASKAPEASGKGHALSFLEITMAPRSARESEHRLDGLHTARTAADDDSHLTIKIGMVELGFLDYRAAECLFLCNLPGGLCIMRLFWAPAVGAASSPSHSFSIGTSRQCGRSSVTETSTLALSSCFFFLPFSHPPLLLSPLDMPGKLTICSEGLFVSVQTHVTSVRHAEGSSSPRAKWIVSDGSDENFDVSSSLSVLVANQATDTLLLQT